MADRGAQSTPFSTRLTDFDDALIKRGICSREQCLRAKGMSDEMYGELLAVVGMAAQTNAVVTALQVEVDDAFVA